MKKSNVNISINKKLFNDIKNLIEENRRFVATTVNASMTMLFWKIGERINGDILENKRAGYGKQIVVTLSRQLPDKKLLQQKLHKAIEVSKKRLKIR